jgi:hypothetical protein
VASNLLGPETYSSHPRVVYEGAGDVIGRLSPARKAGVVRPVAQEGGPN